MVNGTLAMGLRRAAPPHAADVKESLRVIRSLNPVLPASI